MALKIEGRNDAKGGQPAHRGTLKCRRNTRTAILSVLLNPDVRNEGLYIYACPDTGGMDDVQQPSVGESDRTLMTSTIRKGSPGTDPTVETNHPGRLSSARGSDLGGAHTADRRRDCPLNSRLTLSHVRRTSPFGLPSSPSSLQFAFHSSWCLVRVILSLQKHNRHSIHRTYPNTRSAEPDFAVEQPLGSAGKSRVKDRIIWLSRRLHSASTAASKNKDNGASASQKGLWTSADWVCGCIPYTRYRTSSAGVYPYSLTGAGRTDPPRPHFCADPNR